MELLPLVCLCLLTWSGTTFADGNETKIRVLEGRNATLPCSLSSRENIELRRFEWKKDGQEVLVYEAGPLSGQDPQFKDRVSHFQDELKNGNASIIISNTRRADIGIYTCEFQGCQICHIQLVFDGPLKDRRGENIPGAAPEPSIRILCETNDRALLQCVVRGAFPKPKVQWQDSSGNILPFEEPQVSERGGRYDITLQTTVTKTDRYRCVSTQKEISHQIYAETFVSINGFPTGWIVAVAVILGTLFVVGVVLAVLRTRRHRFKKGLPRDKINGRAEEESFPVG